MYFALGDNRKYFNAADLYGIPTASLKRGALLLFRFRRVLRRGGLRFKRARFRGRENHSPDSRRSQLSSARKNAEGYAFLLDVGFLSTSVTVVYGNGIVHEESFDCGLGYILVSLMQGLGVDYETAEEILSSANISGGAVSKDLMWTDGGGCRVLGARDKRNRQVRIGRAVRKRG